MSIIIKLEKCIVIFFYDKTLRQEILVPLSQLLKEYPSATCHFLQQSLGLECLFPPLTESLTLLTTTLPTSWESIDLSLPDHHSPSHALVPHPQNKAKQNKTNPNQPPPPASTVSHLHGLTERYREQNIN